MQPSDPTPATPLPAPDHGARDIPAHWPRITPCPYCADGTAHHPCPPVDGAAINRRALAPHGEAYWRQLEEMAQAVKQGDADENAVVAWMWETLGVQLKPTHPAPAARVTEAMVEAAMKADGWNYSECSEELVRETRDWYHRALTAALSEATNA